MLQKYRTSIFVHACLCFGRASFGMYIKTCLPPAGCKHFVVSKTITEWGLNKIYGNIANDVKALKALKKKCML